MTDCDIPAFGGRDSDRTVFREPIGEDEKLLGELRYAGRLDPVPLEAIVAARSSYAWRTLDAELAELAYDSVLDDNVLAGIRSGDAPPRLLTFESPALTVEIETTPITPTGSTGSYHRLVGQLVPAQAAVLEVQHGDGTISATADELGRFTIEDVPAGPVSVRVRPTGGSGPVTTDWIVL